MAQNIENAQDAVTFLHASTKWWTLFMRSSVEFAELVTLSCVSSQSHS